MYPRKSFYQKLSFQIGAAVVIPLLIFLIAFGPEIGASFRFLIQFLFSFIDPYAIVSPEDFTGLSVILFNCIFGFGFPFLVWLFLISSQAILPVSNLQEIYRTAFHLVVHLLRRHGQAVFVKDGKVVSDPAELKRIGPGVVVVDFNSAVVLEEQLPSPGLAAVLFRIGMNLMVLLGLADRYQSPRICQPGITFLRPHERIRAAVDLRNQFRVKPNNSAYTRDGIEVTANVFSMFTIGQDAEILQVTYQGEKKAENLRVVTFQEQPDGRLRVTDLSDELDSDDQAEIYRLTWQDIRHGQMRDYSPLPARNPLPKFDANRIFAAVSSQARSDQNEKGELIPWVDLPVQVAVDFYRKVLSETNYNDFYRQENDPEYFPLPEYKRKVGRMARNNGILSYRIVLHRTGASLEKDSDYHPAMLWVSDIHPLTSPKPLRERGIKVLFSGFGDLNPVSKSVLKQRLESWRAPWQRDVMLQQTESDYEAMIARGHAYVEAQQELGNYLSQLIGDDQYLEEAFAERILQALEAAAADPNTRQLLPVTTLDIMRTLRDWIV